MPLANPDRKALFADLSRKIAAMSEEQRNTLAATMPVVTVAGHALSVRNACMIAMQIPSATIVGGFRQWFAAGRCVKKGEHGFSILVPASKKDPETGEAGKLFFVSGTVFDVSQTTEIGAVQSELKTETEKPDVAPISLITRPVPASTGYYSTEFTQL